VTNDIAISVQGLGKRYVLGSSKRRHDTLRDLITDTVGGLFRRNKESAEQSQFWALRNASFEIRRGENVGVIGLNGAGKSTLLKMLSRITHPTAGQARINGRVGALLEVGTGFHGELTGRENVFLYGAILGMSQEEIASKFDAMVEFSGIKDFIDTPVKRYSSGMYVRLAFAVAAHLEPEILLLDEVLAVGDVAFQRKCMDFAKALQARQATILFVSHNMFSIKTMCERVIYLRKGNIVYDGPTEPGIALYEKDCSLTALPWTRKSVDEWPLVVSECTLRGRDGRPKSIFEFGERMTVRIAFRAKQRLNDINFIVAFIRSDGVSCCNYTSEGDGVVISEVDGEGVIELTTPPLKLVAELYSISILVREKGYQELLCGQMGATFHIKHELYDVHFGVFHEAAEWNVEGAEVARLEAKPSGTNG
jgi:homopolymeric O-antigen transport system ATP-binding protein